MDLLKAQNKIKKKCSNVYLVDIKPTDILDTVKGKSGINSKDLYMIDIQTLMCQLFCTQHYNVWPRWCQLSKPNNISSTNLIVFNGMTSQLWSECVTKFEKSQKFQKHHDILLGKLNRKVKFINPIMYGIPWKTELFEIPRSFFSKNFNSFLVLGEKTVNKRTFQTAFKSKSDNDSLVFTRKRYNLHFDENTPEFQSKPDAFPRTELLLSLEQMKREHIPTPKENNARWAGFKCSSPDGYDPVTERSPLFAIDCEMVECYESGTERFVKGLASVSIVNEKRETVYKTFVKPSLLIVNYLTKYSGITHEIMEQTTRTVQDVQRDIARLLPKDAILVGHSIGNDLEALQIFHPYLIDTSVIFNLKFNRIYKTKLKNLSHVFLNREIQNHQLDGHDANEDAIATLDLVLLKLSQNLEFGDNAIVVKNENVDKENEATEQLDQQVAMETKPELPDLTDNATHLGHKKKLLDCQKDSINMNNLVERLSMTTVASVNVDFETSGSSSWFPEQPSELAIGVSQQDEATAAVQSRQARTHHLNVAEISFGGLAEGELPSKKWMAGLLKRIVREIDNLPPNSFCGLMMVDGPYRCDRPASAYGQLHLGVTPWNFDNAITKPDV